MLICKNVFPYIGKNALFDIRIMCFLEIIFMKIIENRCIVKKLLI